MSVFLWVVVVALSALTVLLGVAAGSHGARETPGFGVNLFLAVALQGIVVGAAYLAGAQ